MTAPQDSPGQLAAPKPAAPPAVPGRPADAPRYWPDRFRQGPLGSDWTYIRRVIATILLVALAWGLWSIGRVLLLAFAAILIAVLLNGLAGLMERHARVPGRWSLPLAVFVIAALIAAFFVLFGAQVGGQIREVFQGMPEAIDNVGENFGVPNAAARAEDMIAAGASGNVLSRIAGIGFTALGVVADLVLVIVAGIYAAADPKVYRNGAAKLFPPAQHERIHEAFDAVAVSLRLWSGGQLLAMVVVGTAAGLAFWAIGLPSALALGIIAGLTNFIPFLGPVLGAVPALLFATTVGTAAIIWTIVAVVIIQQVEGNVVTPLIQRRTVSLPPAMALFAIVVFGLLFGVLGVFLAVPLAVALMVLVKKLWIRETLGEETSLPGESEEGEGPEPRPGAPG